MKARVFGLSLVVVAIVTALMPVSVGAQAPGTETSVTVTDVVAGAPLVGKHFTTDLQVSVTSGTLGVGVMGAEIWLGFDPAVVSVYDFDGDPGNGTQVEIKNGFFDGTLLVVANEVFYDTPGTDANEEWIELYNPTSSSVGLWLYRLGDEETKGGTEGMYQFPDGALIGPGARIVVAQKATGFRALYGFNSDVEFVDSDDAVPNMSRCPAWASGTFALNNKGDEVILLDSSEAAVDVVTYENGHWPDHVPHPGVETGHSLERWPPARDTNDCSQDFRDQPNPNPGG